MIQMFLSGLIVYMDSQAYGSSAIFGMIEDLNLFTVVSTDPLITETSRYSWGSSITSFGSISVSPVPPTEGLVDQEERGNDSL